MRKIKERYELWKEWRKCNCNTKFYQLMVLFGLARSATFGLFGAMKQFDKEMMKAFDAMGDAIAKMERKANEKGITVDELADEIRRGK